MNSASYRNEIHLLAARSDGTERDALCEWAYRPNEYPTLCAYVRSGITSHTAILRTAAANGRVFA